MRQGDALEQQMNMLLRFIVTALSLAFGRHGARAALGRRATECDHFREAPSRFASLGAGTGVRALAAGVTELTSEVHHSRDEVPTQLARAHKRVVYR
jgi:hypothetical protein